ncbi:MAG: hypothetical protein ACFFDT_36605, partial [Candidatus Hodarchaeota archaeon]
EFFPEARYEKIGLQEMDFREEFDGIVSSFSMLCLDPENFRLTSSKIYEALKIGGYFLLFLNEPGPEGHREEENLTTVLGEPMYSRPYTEDEIRKFFTKGMEFIRVEREIATTSEYGKEYTLLILMKKKNPV